MDSDSLKTWPKRFGPKPSSELELLLHFQISRSLVEALNASGNATDGKNFCDSPKSVAKVIVDSMAGSCIFHLKTCGNRSNIVVWETVVWIFKTCTAYGTYSRFLTLATNPLAGDCNTETARKHSKTLLLIAILHGSLRKDQIEDSAAVDGASRPYTRYTAENSCDMSQELECVRMTNQTLHVFVLSMIVSSFDTWTSKIRDEFAITLDLPSKPAKKLLRRLSQEFQNPW